jgi:hypothetical protein
MNADAIKTLTTDALDKLAVLLDEGHSERLTALLKTMARFHRYSFHNVTLIAMQCPTATRVAGFQTWRSMGRFVRRGEKGIAILAPIVGCRAVESVNDEPESPKTIAAFRAVHVFDVAQTDGQALPEVAQASGDPGDRLSALKAAIVGAGISLEYADDLDGALGTSHGGRIQVRNGLTPAEELIVLAHEWAHEALHRGDDRPASRDTRELEAEAVAFVVGEAVGLNAREAARDYLHLYRGDRDGLAASLDRIRRAAAMILNGMETGG